MAVTTPMASQGCVRVLIMWCFVRGPQSKHVWNGLVSVSFSSGAKDLMRRTSCAGLQMLSESILRPGCSPPRQRW